jgi:hypothetical protein
LPLTVCVSVSSYPIAQQNRYETGKELTRPIWHSGYPPDIPRNRDLPGFEHLIIQILLHHVLELLIELFLIDGFAERCASDGVADLLA